MKKLLKRLLNNKGLTLTEMIVALFLTSVILAIAVGMLAPVKNMMYGMKGNAHMDTMCATANEYIRGTVQAAKSVTIIKLDPSNQFTDEEAVKKAIGSGAKAIAVLNTDPGNSDTPIYRIYDFCDTFDTPAALKGLINSRDSKYAAFNEPFYENTSFVVDFYNSTLGWLQVGSQCKKDYGNDKLEIVNQKHVLNFKLLNGGLSNLYDSGGNKLTDGQVNFSGTGADAAIDLDNEVQEEIAGSSYVIIYTTL